MANQTVASFVTLPVELVYRILDQLSDFTMLCSMTNTLTTLGLGHNAIGAEGAKYLANALQINKTLTTLGLEHNAIGAEGAQDLANALQINKVTKILVLQSSHFT
ncbi:unnamed protein product [Adineta steineri]|uniref:Uncharacterized protein n=1 Tax=Adineta steineri TaxID=433720 RepID=A0A819WG96_9BILA|nr:unnamed protein product [Adineta steineri]